MPEVEELLEDPKIQKLVTEAYLPTEKEGIDDSHVTVKEGLSEDFIKRVKRAMGREIPDPTPEDLKAMAALLKKVFGAELAAYISKQETVRSFNKLVKGEVIPEHYEKTALIRAVDVAKALIDRFTYKEARDWMMTPNLYLLNDLPFDVIRDDPELVRKAALWRHGS